MGVDLAELVKWIIGIAIGAATGGLIGTRLAIWLIERRAGKTANKYIAALKENPEIKEYIEKGKRIIDNLDRFMKKIGADRG